MPSVNTILIYWGRCTLFFLFLFFFLFKFLKNIFLGFFFFFFFGVQESLWFVHHNLFKTLGPSQIRIIEGGYLVRTLLGMHALCKGILTPHTNKWWETSVGNTNFSEANERPRQLNMHPKRTLVVFYSLDDNNPHEPHTNGKHNEIELKR
jgi:hypothetical protein